MEIINKAPDAEILLSDATVHQLSELWKSRPIFLVFLRHFG
jgi:hypothetical protein